MTIHEVPRSDREQFCRRFTAQRAGERVAVGIRPDTRAADKWQALERMDYDPSADRLRIWTTDGRSTTMLHFDGVSHLMFSEPDRESGYVEARSASDRVLRIRFRNQPISRAS